MAGTNPKTPGSPAFATSAAAAADVDTGHTGADRATRLRSLLEQARAYRGRLSEAANQLVVEVDGMTVAMTEGRVARPRAFALPFDGRSLTVRDENGCARAHLLLDQPCMAIDYDGGRLSLSLERDDSARTMTLVLRCLEEPGTAHESSANQ